MDTRANYVWVGVVTLLLLAGLAAFVIWLAQLGERGQRDYDIFFKQSVSGLAEGSGVTFAGVPSGQVTDISLWPRDPEFVRVRISIDEDTPVLQGTTATIQGIGFTGVSQIQLDGAVKGAPPLTEIGPEGVPVIPTRQGGLGALLNNAPLLIERLATLTERLTRVLSDENQDSIAGILSNTDRLTANLADASPELRTTLSQLRGTLASADRALLQFEGVAGSAQRLLDDEGRPLAADLRATLASAREAAAALEGTLKDARPGVRQLTTSTIPETEALIRDLRAMSRTLRRVAERLDEGGAGSLVSSPALPDYEP